MSSCKVHVALACSINREVCEIGTEAAGKVYTQEKPEGYIRGQEASRRLMAKNDSKQDLTFGLPKGVVVVRTL